MKTTDINNKFAACFFAGILSTVLLFSFTQVNADPITPELQTKVEKYKLKLVEWVKNPIILDAIRQANANGSLAGMNNAKWDDLKDDAPEVRALITSAAGKVLVNLESDKSISKLYIRDFKGNLVAGSNKPLLFNNSTRPQYLSPIKGQVFSANEAKPDPTTSIMGVQIAAPIMDGDKVIGVINSSVNQ